MSSGSSVGEEQRGGRKGETRPRGAEEGGHAGFYWNPHALTHISQTLGREVSHAS